MQEIELLISLQQRLVDAYRTSLPGLVPERLLLSAPQRVELLTDDERWQVTRHGVGLRFVRTSPIPCLVVDLHEDPWDLARVDAWRVQQLVESYGKDVSFEAVEARLQAMAKAGRLVCVANGVYRIPQRPA